MKHNEENERVKRAYRLHLKAARGLNDASIDVATAAIHRFEESTGFRSFKKYHYEQAVAFRRRLEDAWNERTGKPISKATTLQVLNALRAFFLWLAEQPGYRSRIRYSDADYFRLSEKDTRVAKATKARPVPTPPPADCRSRETAKAVTGFQPGPPYQRSIAGVSDEGSVTPAGSSSRRVFYSGTGSPSSSSLATTTPPPTMSPICSTRQNQSPATRFVNVY